MPKPNTNTCANSECLCIVHSQCIFFCVYDGLYKINHLSEGRLPESALHSLGFVVPVLETPSFTTSVIYGSTIYKRTHKPTHKHTDEL